MYNSPDKIFDEETNLLTYNHGVNTSFTVSEILNSRLWYVDVFSNNILRCIPVFNCKSIVSSNSDDYTTNQYIIINISKNPIITVKSEKGLYNTGENTFLHAYSIVNSLTSYLTSLKIYCFVYDNYFKALTDLDVEVYINNEYIDTVKTNTDGICEYTITRDCSIFFKIEDNESNTIIIGEE